MKEALVKMDPPIRITPRPLRPKGKMDLRKPRLTPVHLHRPHIRDTEVADLNRTLWEWAVMGA